MSRRGLIQAGMLVAPAIMATQAAQASLTLAAAGPERLREESRALPPITFLDAEGQEKMPADFAGQGLVLNLWATWCPPCVAEMPALSKMAAALAADRIAVLPLSSDRGGKPVVEAFYQRVGLSGLGIWLDPRGAAARALGARGLPTTVIVDRNGQERARLEGDAAWDNPAMIEAVRRLVGPFPARDPTTRI
jgi:thiol-disulfide isomerase/thioredoxin